MSDEPGSQHDIRRVLLETFPQLQALPDEMLDVLAAGQPAVSAAPPGVQPMHWTQMIQEAEHWAPFVAHVVAIVQGMLAIIRKPEKPPTAAEIADQVTSRMNVDNPNMAMTYDPVIAQRIARVTLALYEPSAEK